MKTTFHLSVGDYSISWGYGEASDGNPKLTLEYNGEKRVGFFTARDDRMFFKGSLRELGKLVELGQAVARHIPATPGEEPTAERPTPRGGQ